MFKANISYLNVQEQFCEAKWDVHIRAPRTGHGDCGVSFFFCFVRWFLFRPLFPLPSLLLRVVGLVMHPLAGKQRCDFWFVSPYIKQIPAAYISVHFCAFSTGIWSRDIRYKSNLPLTEINKILKNLESKKLIKAVKSVAVSSLWLVLF